MVYVVVLIQLSTMRLPRFKCLPRTDKGATVKLKKGEIDKLPIPEVAPAFYRDDELKGFGVKVFASGVKSFFLEKRVAGKVKRISIGRYGELTAEQARKQAMKLAGEIATGGDPIAEKKEAELKAITLGQAYADYLSARKDLKPKTLGDYGRVIGKAFADWNKKPLLSITKDMVGKRHTLSRRDGGLHRGERGKVKGTHAENN